MRDQGLLTHNTLSSDDGAANHVGRGIAHIQIHLASAFESVRENMVTPIHVRALQRSDTSATQVMCAQCFNTHDTHLVADPDCHKADFALIKPDEARQSGVRYHVPRMRS